MTMFFGDFPSLISITDCFFYIKLNNIIQSEREKQRNDCIKSLSCDHLAPEEKYLIGYSLFCADIFCNMCLFEQ